MNAFFWRNFSRAKRKSSADSTFNVFLVSHFFLILDSVPIEIVSQVLSLFLDNGSYYFQCQVFSSTFLLLRLLNKKFRKDKRKAREGRGRESEEPVFCLIKPLTPKHLVHKYQEACLCQQPANKSHKAVDDWYVSILQDLFFWRSCPDAREDGRFTSNSKSSTLDALLDGIRYFFGSSSWLKAISCLNPNGEEQDLPNLE